MRRDKSPLWAHIKELYGIDFGRERRPVSELTNALEVTLQWYAACDQNSVPMIDIVLHDGTVVRPREFLERFAPNLLK